ncbi:MAG: hypothetical protein ACI92I_000414 [Acidimicrobiales bacterium]|jgi:hypothetical protein
MKYFTLLTFLILFIFPVVTSAETVLRTGSDISVESDQVVEGDYYVSVGPFGRTTMSGQVAEDMYAFGAEVIVNGEIGNDVTILSGSSQIHASVTDDVRIVAVEATIAEEVGGDVFVLAGSLSILSSAKIAGDVFFFGGNLTVEGDVAGSVRGSAEKVRIDSGVGGDVDISAPAGITLGDRASISGSVLYTSFVPLSRGQRSIVEGEVVRNEYASIPAKEKARDVLIPIFITLFATLSLYLLFKRELQSVVESVEERFSKNFLVGVMFVLLGPLVSILLMITVLGLLVGLLALSFVLMLYVAGVALSGVVLGAFIMRIFTKKLRVTLPAILLGAVGIQSIILVPVIGPVAVFSIFAVTVGAIVQRLYRAVA